MTCALQYIQSLSHEHLTKANIYLAVYADASSFPLAIHVYWQPKSVNCCIVHTCICMSVTVTLWKCERWKLLQVLWVFFLHLRWKYMHISNMKVRIYSFGTDVILICITLLTFSWIFFLNYLTVYSDHSTDPVFPITFTWDIRKGLAPNWTPAISSASHPGFVVEQRTTYLTVCTTRVVLTHTRQTLKRNRRKQVFNPLVISLFSR